LQQRNERKRFLALELEHKNNKNLRAKFGRMRGMSVRGRTPPLALYSLSKRRKQAGSMGSVTARSC
jgi:hypothetical protein